MGRLKDRGRYKSLTGSKGGGGAPAIKIDEVRIQGEKNVQMNCGDKDWLGVLALQERLHPKCTLIGESLEIREGERKTWSS